MIDASTPTSGERYGSGRLLQPTEALARIRREMPRLLLHLSSRIDADGFPLVRICREPEDPKVHRLTSEESGPITRWFFIGDIHGDFYALSSLMNAAETLDPDCRIAFLGDIGDRGHLSLECIFLLLDWGLRHPGRLAWIAGNHDVAYGFSGGRFVSSCSPAEMLEELNVEDESAPARQKMGAFFVRLASLLPRALLFPEGLLATHGGIPHTDLQKEAVWLDDPVAYFQWLNSEPCQNDFTWTRISRYPRKFPDRFSSGAEYGYRDFEDFCDLKPEFFPVTSMVTGHEHADGGACTNPSYTKYPALTLLGQGFDDLLDRNSAAFYLQYRDVLRLGRGVPGRAPQVVDVPVYRDELYGVYQAQLSRDGYPVPTTQPERQW